MKTYLFTGILAMLSFALQAQDYKNNISIVQFSASFVEENEISLKKFREYNTYTFRIENDTDKFVKEGIEFIPTLVLYNNGKEIARIESGISLKLPDDCEQIIMEKIEEIIESKF